MNGEDVQRSCHCGAVRFEADLDLTVSTYRCNCSICRRNRFWVAVVKPENFRLLAGEHEMSEYRFNTADRDFSPKHCLDIKTKDLTLASLASADSGPILELSQVLE